MESRGSVVPENQRQFRPAQDQRLNAIFIAHARRNRQQALTGLRQKLAGDQLMDVFVVDVILLFRCGHGQREPFT